MHVPVASPSLEKHYEKRPDTVVAMFLKVLVEQGYFELIVSMFMICEHSNLCQNTGKSIHNLLHNGSLDGDCEPAISVLLCTWCSILEMYRFTYYACVERV